MKALASRFNFRRSCSGKTFRRVRSQSENDGLRSEFRPIARKGFVTGFGMTKRVRASACAIRYLVGSAELAYRSPIEP